jgi:hypothetical protein
MGDPTAAPGRACAHSCAQIEAYVHLLKRELRNDRFETDPGSRGEADLAYRRGWNAAVEHVESAILKRVGAELAVLGGLQEIEEATR